MKTVKVTMYLDITDSSMEYIKKIEHHAEYLLDLDNPDLLSVYGVKVETID